jgi:hypothetical protein
MSSPVTAIRNRLVEGLSYHGIGTQLEISLSEAADFGLMNGAMIVRAVGLHLDFVNPLGLEPSSLSPEQRTGFVDASYAAADHIASLADRQANEAMAEIFGESFIDCFYLAKRIQRIGSNPYEDVRYPREATEQDQVQADILDAHMTGVGAQYLRTPNGQLLIATEAQGVEGRGCPLRYKTAEQPAELHNVMSTLVDEYLDPDSEFYGKGYHGMANFVLLAARQAQPHFADLSDDARIDWQLPQL